MQNSLLCLILLAISVNAFYEGDSRVVELTVDNFDEEVLNSEYLWIVEFYAPWCGHCKSLAPEFDKAAKALDGIIKLGAVDMTQHGAVGQKYSVSGYPTLYFFGDDKENPQLYEDGRITKDLIRFAINKARKISAQRAGITLKERPAGFKTPAEEKEEERAIDESNVIVLDKANFESEFMSSDEPWLINFYAAYSDPSKKLKPVWAELATKLQGKYKVAKIDAPDNRDIADIYDAKNYPVMKFFPRGDKYLVKPQDYYGKQTVEDISEWTAQQDEQNAPALFQQLTTQQIYDDNCSDQASVCVIIFVPHIYDSSTVERNRYLNLVRKVAQKHSDKPLRFVWSEGGSQYLLEQNLDAGGSGFPAVAAVSTRAAKCSVMKGALTEQNLNTFITGITSGKTPFVNYREKAKIKTIEEWDGLDHQPEFSVRDDEDI